MALAEEHDLPLLQRALRGHASVEDMAVVTWAVPPLATRGLMPPGFELRTFTTPFGERALLSTVAYRYRNLWLRAAPFLPIRAVQVHHRLHVTFRGQPGVWFLGTWMDNPRANLPRRLWGMPWWRAEIGLAATWEAGRLVDHRTVVGEGTGQGALHLEAPEDDDRVPPAIAELVVNPDQGWWKRTAGPHYGSLAVGHRPQGGHQATVVRCQFRPLLDAGLVSTEATPWFARVVRSFEIAVGTPPSVVCLRPTEAW
jgi:uncharacterized protein YqjF (DUF2071 family)